MNHGRLLALCCSAVVWTSSAVCAQSIQSLVPAAVKPGETTEVVVRGTKLDEPLRVWSSLPAKIEVVAENAEAKDRTEIKLRVAVDAATPPQIGGLFIATSAGVSDPVFFAIDDLPSVVDNGKNQSQAAAQLIPPLVAIDGVVDGTTADYYKFTATAGQRVAVEVWAGRLGSTLDALVQLVDNQGQLLMTADDDVGFGADGRLEYTAAMAGEYFLSIRDVRYRGGARYRLRVGDFPLVTTPYPLGVAVGQSTPVEAAGLASATASPLTSIAQANAIAFKTTGGQSSAIGAVVTSAYPQSIETEPNDSPEAATEITLPCGINGRFAVEKDRDQFRFAAKEGEVYRFRPVTRSLGSPCYVQLSVFKPDGALLAEAPVTDTDEQVLQVTFPAAGVYRLVVEDLLRRGGSEYAWHVEAAPALGVELALKPDKNTPHKLAVPKNGVVMLDVLATRQGYDGPITLAVEPAEYGFTLLNNVIAEKQTATRLVLVAPPNATLGDAVGLRIVGAIQRDGKSLSLPVSSTALARLKSPHIAYPPAWLAGLLPTAIIQDAPELFTITPAAPQIVYPRSAGQVTFTLTMDRKQKDFKDAVVITPLDLPSGVAAEIKREGNGPQEKYLVVLKAPPDIAEVQQEVRFRCLGELAGRGQLLTVSVPLSIVTPITATVAPEGPISPGKTQKVKVAITRPTGADPQPVTIKWKKLPPGVTAAGDAAIPAEQTEVVVKLTAAADAAVGAFDALTVTAVTKFQGVDVALDSAPVSFEVK